MQARRLVIGYIFYLCISIWAVYIYGFMSLKNIWSPLLLYFFIIYFLYLIWYKLKRKEYIDFFWFFILFLYKTALYLSILCLSIWAFLYYQNNIFPAKLPIYSISNGKQNIVFQTMSHIGSESFYLSVAERINRNKKSWSVLYYEWVLPWNEENTQGFNSALWMNFKPGLYDSFSKLYWIQAQDNADFLWLVNNEDYNIDLDLDTIMDLYRKKVWSSAEQNKWLLWNEKVRDLNDDVISQLSQLWDRELLVLRYINQWILNFIIKHSWIRNFIIDKIANEDIFAVILEDRNKHLVQEILTRDDEKIIVLYGLMHFEWVLELLQSQDSKWEILNIDYQQIITQD